jgi:uncharacterized membrane protein
VHIPVILAVLVESWAVGLGVGLVFGVCSLIRSWETASVGLSLFLRDPLVSVAPRLLVPIVAWLVYLLWKKVVRQNKVTDKAGIALAAAMGAVTNTVCCLGMILVLYGNDLNELIRGMNAVKGAEAVDSGNGAAWLIAVVGLPNGIAEAIVAAVLVPILITAVDAVQRRSGRRAQKERNA